MAEDAKNKYGELMKNLEEEYKKKNEELLNTLNEKAK